VTLRVIRVFTAAFPGRVFGNADSCRSGSAGGLAIAIEYSLLRWKKRLKGRAVTQPRCSDSHFWRRLDSAEDTSRLIAAHSAPVALRDGILYVRVLQPALHYELEQISKSEILRKLKQRFGGKIIRDVRFRVG